MNGSTGDLTNLTELPTQFICLRLMKFIPLHFLNII